MPEMASEVAAAKVTGVKHLSSAEATAEEEKLRLLREAVQALPVNAVKDLWSIGVCLFFIDILIKRLILFLRKELNFLLYVFELEFVINQLDC